MATSWGKGTWGKTPWSSNVPLPQTPSTPPQVEGNGWGTDSFGTAPYGSNEAGVSIHMVGAVAISTNSVEVTLSGQPLAQNPVVPGDALNPLTWTIQRTDDGDFFDVASIQIVSPTKFVIFVLEQFGPANVTHIVSSLTLLDQSGNTILTPNSATFAGIQAESDVDDQARGVARGFYSQDIANPQTPNGLAQYISGGTLRIVSGDYTTESGDALYKKLVERRITTRPGDFFHLPDYGIDLPEKTPMNTSDLIKLKKQVEQQVAKEPETAQVLCTPTIDMNGVLLLNVEAKSNITGNTVSISVPVPPQSNNG